jgi:hypothetical protein
MSNSKFTRDEKTNLLMAWDIFALREDLKKNDYQMICGILRGEGYQQYDNMTEEDFDNEFYEKYDEQIKYSTKILQLAHVLNGEPINLLKV